MSVYGNMIQRDIISFLIEESENFNFNFNEIEVIEEGVKDSLGNFKNKVEKIFNIFIEFCKRVKETIKKFFNEKILKTAMDKATKISNKLHDLYYDTEYDEDDYDWEALEKEFEETEEDKKEYEERQKELRFRKAISEANKEFIKRINSNYYVLVDASKFVKIEGSNIEKYNNKIKDILDKIYKRQISSATTAPERLDEDLVDNLFHSYSIANYIASDFIGDKIADYDKGNDFIKLKSITENELKKSSNDKSLWDKTHFTNKGYPTITNFPSIYKSYCEQIEKDKDKFEKYIDKLTDNSNKIKTLILKNGSFDLEDNKSYSDGNNHSAYHYKKYYVDITNRYIQAMSVSVQYLKYMVELDMKGIKAGGILLGFIGNLIDKKFIGQYHFK